MNKAVQILLFFALFPMIGSAREETLEERKQRISRKYMREHTNIAQSDLLVPSEEIEDERITDSEGFNEMAVDFQRQEAGIKPPTPPSRPMPRPTDRNWLLDQSEMEEDPSADPFDPFQSNDAKTEGDYWALWGGKPEDDSVKETATRESRYDRNSYDSRDPSSRGMIDPRSQQGFYGEEQDSRYGSAEREYGQQGSLFGSRQGGSTFDQSSRRQGTRTYGSSPDTGMLRTPFSQMESPETGRSQRGGVDREQGYTPYQSPYQKQREEQRGQKQSWGPQEQEQEYQKPDAYKQWKGRSKDWDPTRDDAYLNDLMQQNR